MREIRANIDYRTCGEGSAWHVATIQGATPEGIAGTPAGRVKNGTPASALRDLQERIRVESGVSLIPNNPPAHNLHSFEVREAWQAIASNGNMDYFWSEFHFDITSAGVIRMKFRRAMRSAEVFEGLPMETQEELLEIAFPDAP